MSIDIVSRETTKEYTVSFKTSSRISGDTGFSKFRRMLHSLKTRPVAECVSHHQLRSCVLTLTGSLSE